MQPTWDEDPLLKGESFFLLKFDQGKQHQGWEGRVKNTAIYCLYIYFIFVPEKAKTRQ